jgi:hypothetical protein
MKERRNGILDLHDVDADPHLLSIISPVVKGPSIKVFGQMNFHPSSNARSASAQSTH